MRKIISFIIVFTFFINSVAFGLGTAVTSNVIGDEVRPGTKPDMYALGQKLFAEKNGPGVIDVDKYKRPEKFIGEAPEIEGMEFKNFDDKDRMEGWENNPILEKEDLIEAFKYFRDNEAKISEDKLEIVEGYFPVDEKNGELPIARIEPLKDGTYRLVLHTKFVQMWNDIRKRDVRFSYDFADGKEPRIVSLAWGIFYRIAKHEMSDLKKSGLEIKSLGHLTLDPIHGITLSEDELSANKIGGKYAFVNDSIWMWFLGSYAFNGATCYNNDLLEQRLGWFFNKEGKGLNDLKKEFPNLLSSTEIENEAIDLATAINYRFFSDMRAPLTGKVKQAEKVKYEKRKETIKGEPVYAGGADDGLKEEQVKKVLDFLAVRDEIPEEGIDLLLVLGSPDLEVARGAAKLYLASPDKFKYIMCSGKGKGETAEAEIFKAEMIANGVPEEKFLDSETESMFMAQNLEFSIKKLEDAELLGEIKNIMMVQVPLYNRQAKAAAELIFPEGIKPLAYSPYMPLAKPDLEGTDIRETFEGAVKAINNLKDFMEKGWIASVDTTSIDSIVQSVEILLQETSIDSEELKKDIKMHEEFLPSIIPTRIDENITREQIQKEEQNNLINALMKLKDFESKNNIALKALRSSNSSLRFMAGHDAAVELLEESKFFREQLYMSYEHFIELKFNLSKEDVEDIKLHGFKAEKDVIERRESKLRDLFAKIDAEIEPKKEKELFKQITNMWAFDQFPQNWIIVASEHPSDRIQFLRQLGDGAAELEKWEKIKESTYMALEAYLSVPKDIVEDNIKLVKKSETFKEAIDYIIDILVKEGPGSVKELTEEKRINVWQAVNLMHETSIEVYLPQTIKLTKGMKDVLMQVNQKMKGNGLSLNIVRYRDNNLLSSIEKSKKKTKNEVKRIVITDKDTRIAVGRLLFEDDNVKQFRDVRVLNMNVPETISEDRLTIIQAQVIMIAILARLLEGNKNLEVKQLLTEILENSFARTNVDVGDFVNRLSVEEDDTTTIERVRDRIGYFLDDIRAISLIKKLEQELRALREFWTYA